MKRIELFEQMLAQQDGKVEDKKAYNYAQWYCANAYRVSRNIKSQLLIFKNVFYNTTPKEISDVLRDNEIFRFALACPTTGLLEYLDELQREGWKMRQMITLPTTRFEVENDIRSPAIYMSHTKL